MSSQMAVVRPKLRVTRPSESDPSACPQATTSYTSPATRPMTRARSVRSHHCRQFISMSSGSGVSRIGRAFVLVVAVILTKANAAAPRSLEIIPAAAPPGARVIVAGAILETDNVAVSFPATAGGRATAPVVARGSRYVEVRVPPDAATGGVHVTVNGSVTELAFVVAPQPRYMSVSTLAGGLQNRNTVKNPEGLALDPLTGNVYVADTKNHQIKVLTPEGAIAVVAGAGSPGFVDGLGTSAAFKEPRGLVFDTERRLLYVADSANHAVRRVTLEGVVTTVAGSGQPGDRSGIGTDALFKEPRGVAVDITGNLYVADAGNHKIRRVATDGAVVTVAGSGREGFADGQAAEARFAGPEGISVDLGSGVVYVADTGNSRIRKIADGVVTTLAGTGDRGLTDGPAPHARFHSPHGVVLGDAGNLFIADTGNNVIR
jgi:DNA-binding beta-propeller fold protein YncE